MLAFPLRSNQSGESLLEAILGLLDTIMSLFGMATKAAEQAAGASDAPEPASAPPPTADDPTEDADDGDATGDADDWNGPGDWAPAAWRTGDYTAEQAEDLIYEDLDEDDPTPPSWHSKRHNPTDGFGTLHVIDLATIRNGEARRLFAVYGIPVGWGKQDADKEEFQQRIDTINAAIEDGDADDVLSSFGFLDEDHFEFVADRAAPGYREAGDMQERIDEVMRQQKAELNARAQGELAGELEPVEGVSMEQWAQAQASLANGGSLDAILPVLGIDQPAWDRVSAEWNARMSRDATATIATVYGQAFSSGGAGQFGAAGANAANAMLDESRTGVDGEEPFSFEKWVEITQAQNAGVAQGKDPAEILSGFGMTPADWGVASGWWSQKFAADSMNLMAEFDRLTEKYKAQYSAPAADDDVQF